MKGEGRSAKLSSSKKNFFLPFFLEFLFFFLFVFPFYKRREKVGGREEKERIAEGTEVQVIITAGRVGWWGG